MMLRLFLQFELHKIAKYYRTKAVAKMITTVLFFGVFIFIGVGIYFFFVSGFRFIRFEAVEDIRSALTLFLYEQFLIVLGGIIVFSSMVSGIFNLFKGGYNNWIISSPQYRIFPRLILIRSLLSSSLPSLVMFLPAVLAFTKVYSLSVLSVLFILLSVVLLLIILNALTLIFILFISYFYFAIAKRFSALQFNLRNIIVTILLLIVGSVTILWKIVRDVDLVKLFRAENVDENLSVANISNHFHFLPTHPFAVEILNWQNGETSQALTNFMILTVLAVASGVLWWYVSIIFYPIWKKLQEGSTPYGLENSTSSRKLPYTFSGNTSMALFKKEALVSTRNYKGALWFLFLFLIWLAQIGANVILSHNVARHETDISAKIATLQALQFIIAVYFMSSFTLRFVFPSFSVEKKTAWILASAPLSFRRIFFGKYLFYTVFFVILGVIMSTINSNMLHLSFTYAFYSILLFIITTIFIVTSGLSIGAIFPSTETDDPEVISTSMSGLSFTALALIYGAISAGVLYITLLRGFTSLLLLFSLLTFVFIFLLLLKTPLLVKSRVL